MQAKEMLSEEQKQFYRDQLRSARNVALADAEGFMAVVYTLELMGQQLVGKICMGLGEYKKKLKGVASLSSLAHKVDPTYHVKFSTLFDELKDARNDAVHLRCLRTDTYRSCCGYYNHT